MTEVSARLAAVDDLALLADLTTHAWAEQIDARGGAMLFATAERTGTSLDRASSAMDHARMTVWLGCIDDVAVGYAAVRLDRLPADEYLAVIEDIFVLPDARAIGVGEAMADAVTNFARENNCVGIDAVALPGNRATKNFFETLGLTARAIVVHKSLRPKNTAE